MGPPAVTGRRPQRAAAIAAASASISATIRSGAAKCGMWPTPGSTHQAGAGDLALQRARMEVRPDDPVGVAGDDDRGRADGAVAAALLRDEGVEAGDVLRVGPERPRAEHQRDASRFDVVRRRVLRLEHGAGGGAQGEKAERRRQDVGDERRRARTPSSACSTRRRRRRARDGSRERGAPGRRRARRDRGPCWWRARRTRNGRPRSPARRRAGSGPRRSRSPAAPARPPRRRRPGRSSRGRDGPRR